MLQRYQFIAAVIALVLAIAPHSSHSFPRLGLLKSYAHETTIEREYPLANAGTLTIRNVDGNIRIETEWRGSVALRAIKRAAREDQLPRMSIEKYAHEKDGHTYVTISTTYENNEVDGCVDYVLAVPTHINLRLRTGYGTITIQDVQGCIAAQTRDGNIDIERVTGPVIAQTKSKGNITLDSIGGGIKAVTKTGNINIENATRSIVATSDEGNIAVTFKKLLESSRVVLHSRGGTVSTRLPSQINAHVIGQSEGVTLQSDHYLALRPNTKLEKEVSSYCNELARRVCHCMEQQQDDEEIRAGKGKSVAKKVRNRLAQAFKYVYPFGKSS